MALHLDLTKSPSQVFSRNLVRIKSIQHIQDDLHAGKPGKLETKLSFLKSELYFAPCRFLAGFL